MRHGGRWRGNHRDHRAQRGRRRHFRRVRCAPRGHPDVTHLGSSSGTADVLLRRASGRLARGRAGGPAPGRRLPVGRRNWDAVHVPDIRRQRRATGGRRYAYADGHRTCDERREHLCRLHSHQWSRGRAAARRAGLGRGFRRRSHRRKRPGPAGTGIRPCRHALASVASLQRRLARVTTGAEHRRPRGRRAGAVQRRVPDLHPRSSPASAQPPSPHTASRSPSRA